VRGAVISESVYLPFGQSSDSERYGFTGKEFDETELNYFGMRYYSPETGRFLTVDPMLEGFSPYPYVRNNPMTLVDPTGGKSKKRVKEQLWIPVAR